MTGQARLGLVAVIVAAGLASCRHDRTCRQDTVLMRVVLPASIDPRSVRTLEVVIIADDGNTLAAGSVAFNRNERSGTVEVDLAGRYPAERAITAAVEARQGATVLASGAVFTTLPAGCSAFDVSLSPPAAPEEDGGAEEEGGAPDDDASAGEDSAGEVIDGETSDDV